MVLMEIGKGGQDLGVTLDDCIYMIGPWHGC